MSCGMHRHSIIQSRMEKKECVSSRCINTASEVISEAVGVNVGIHTSPVCVCRKHNPRFSTVQKEILCR